MPNVRDPAAVVKPWMIYGYREVQPERGRSTRKMLKRLLKLLGDRAAQVWCALMGLRDPETGLAHPTAAGLARKLGVSRATVTRALERLARAGLVKSGGEKYVPRARQRVWVRWVWGNLDGAFVQVPWWTADWMSRADEKHNHGGWRPRSGRRREERPVPEKSFQPITDREESSEPPIMKTSEKSSYPLSGDNKTTRAGARGNSVKTFSASGFKGLKQPFGPHRTRLDWWKRLLRDGVVPRLDYGPRGDVPHAVIPMPAKLSPDAEPADLAWTLAVAYRGYVSRKTGKRSHLFARGKFENSKHYPALLAWATYMTTEVDPESQISPAVWIAFRDWTWEKDQPAPVSYVFSLPQLKKSSNRGWCRREAVERWRVQSGIQVWGPEARELRERYRKLRQACLTARECYGDDIVRRLVEHIFPEGSFEYLVQQARIGQRRYQNKINERVAAGDLSVYTEAR